jgi:hypothetical protein
MDNMDDIPLFEVIEFLQEDNPKKYPHQYSIGEIKKARKYLFVEYQKKELFDACPAVSSTRTRVRM